jgi:hypothetical protein
MDSHLTSRARVLIASALALTLLPLPCGAVSVSQEVFARRADIPDAHLRGVTHVVCATFPEGGVTEVPQYERRSLGFQPAGTLPRARTAPLSRWVDPGGSQTDCYPAFAYERANEHGVPVQYAHVILDIQTGRKAWLRDGGADDAKAVWVTIESLRPLEAFEDMGVEFDKLRREDQPPLVFLAEPRDDASEVQVSLHYEQVSLGKRVGDFAEVIVFDEERQQQRHRGWVRLVDAQGTLLLWPANYPSHGC